MKAEDLTPTLDRVLVRKIAPERETASGIVLPAGTESQLAEVLAVGPGKDFPGGIPDPVPVNVGDTVVIGRGGWPVYVDGEELMCCRIAEVYAVVG